MNQMLKTIFLAAALACTGYTLSILHGICKEQQERKNELKDEMYMTMQDFIEFYDEHRELFMQNLNDENFSKVLRKRNFTTSPYALVPFGDSRCQIPVYNSEMMRLVLFYHADYILNLVHQAAKLYEFDKHDILNYSEFQSRLYELQKTCEKFGTEILID